MTIPEIVGLNIVVALIGFWFGNIAATRSLYRTTCQCHTPVRWALLRYAGISLTFMVVLAGCVMHTPRSDRATLEAMSLRRKSVEKKADQECVAMDLKTRKCLTAADIKARRFADCILAIPNSREVTEADMERCSK